MKFKYTRFSVKWFNYKLPQKLASVAFKHSVSLRNPSIKWRLHAIPERTISMDNGSAIDMGDKPEP